MISLRDKAKARFRRTGNPVHGDYYYRDMRNLKNAAIKREKDAYLDCSAKH